MTATARTALVTGASGGIGLELARVFARNGYDLVLVARSRDTLRSAAEGLAGEFGIRARAIPRDLSNPAAPREIAEELEQDSVAVHTLVNNAGFTMTGPFAEADPERSLDMMRLNMEALTHLTRRFLPGMVRRAEGGILNVASTAAFLPGPLMAVYYATKSYVLSFSRALAAELQGSGVRVSVLCPGATRTGFQRRGNLEEARLVKGKRLADPRRVAEAGFRGYVRGRTVVVPGPSNKLIPLLARLMPSRLLASAAELMHRPSSRAAGRG